LTTWYTADIVIDEDAFILEKENELSEMLNFDFLRIIENKELMIMKQFNYDANEFRSLIHGQRKFTKDHFMPSMQAFLTC
jgi:hypothetical protein